MAEIYKAKGKKKERLSVRRLRKVVGELGKESLLTSFRSFPAKVCFETQGDGEVVVLFMRQHPIVNVPWMALSILLLSLAPLLSYFPPYSGLPGEYQWIVILTYYLFVMGLSLAKFMGWFFNIYIVTDERIVDVDFVNLFYRVISTAKIEEIQDLSVVESGMTETFFDYGKIEIQTAAEITQFEFDKVPHPDKVARILNLMIDQEEQEKLEGRVR